MHALFRESCIILSVLYRERKVRVCTIRCFGVLYDRIMKCINDLCVDSYEFRMFRMIRTCFGLCNFTVTCIILAPTVGLKDNFYKFGGLMD